MSFKSAMTVLAAFVYAPAKELFRIVFRKDKEDVSELRKVLELRKKNKQ